MRRLAPSSVLTLSHANEFVRESRGKLRAIPKYASVIRSPGDMTELHCTP